MKQSWDAQMIWMKWPKVSKVSFSLRAAGKQRKDIESHVGCSKASVSRVINAVACCCCKPATKPLLNRKQKLKRFQWANLHKDCTKMHKNAQKWSKVIFSDQSKFCIEFGALVWRTKDERHNPALCINKRYGQYCLFIKSTVTADVYISVSELPFIHRGSV